MGVGVGGGLRELFRCGLWLRLWLARVAHENVLCLFRGGGGRDSSGSGPVQQEAALGWGGSVVVFVVAHDDVSFVVAVFFRVLGVGLVHLLVFLCIQKLIEWKFDSRTQDTKTSRTTTTDALAVTHGVGQGGGRVEKGGGPEGSAEDRGKVKFLVGRHEFFVRVRRS